MPISGIKILEERKGDGQSAQKGDIVEFESEGFLNQGQQIQEIMTSRIRLGHREVIAGIEKSLFQMKVDGYRKVKISPHLAYRDVGVEGLIPPNAVLIYCLWLKRIEQGPSV